MNWNSTVPEPHCEKQGIDVPCPRCGYTWTIRRPGIAVVLVWGDMYSCPNKARQLDASHTLFGDVSRHNSRENA